MDLFFHLMQHMYHVGVHFNMDMVVAKCIMIVVSSNSL